MHVCVLGAGIVGLSTAYELIQRGFKVTVVDSAAHVGAGASGNIPSIKLQLCSALGRPLHLDSVA